MGGGNLDASPDAPSIKEEVFAGSSPHNCGGGCVIKAYVQDGVIKRFTTDETPEKTYLDPTPGDYMQDRACPRCRSQKSWIYGSNRLLYPMVQTKERGDLSGFRRITWAEAAKYFKAKADKVIKEYGPGAFHDLYSSGMGGGYNPATDMFGMVGALGSSMLNYHDDYSFPQWELITRCMHDANSQPRSNDFQDVYNSDELIVWGYNLSEMLNQQQINFTLTQVHEIFKRDKKKITVIDPKYTNTAILGADEFIAPIQGTDTAMICGMLHYILTEKLPELGKLYATHSKPVSDGAEKAILEDSSDVNFVKTLRNAIGRYVYGFFDTDDADTDSNDSYMLESGDNTTFKSKVKVMPGTSWSAYIFGSKDYLVNTKAFNKAISVYPDDIGYNVRSYKIDGEHDELWDETKGRSRLTKCYGQVEKTPEWAEKICGVPAATIKSLADKFLTKNISCWMMGGLQRNSEGDQACWAWTVLMNVLLCFGKEGRSHGRADGRGNDQRKRIDLGWESDIKAENNLAAIPAPEKVPDYLSTDKKKWTKELGDKSLLTFPTNYNSNHSLNTISVFTWLDAADAGNREKVSEKHWTLEGGLQEKTEAFYPSRWNDGQVKRIPAPLKFIFHCGGNINVNQNGDCNLATEVFTAADPTLANNDTVFGDVKMNPYGYKVEFVGMIEVVMTSSCRWADLVLPGSISFERYQTHSGGRSPLTSVTTKAVNPPGDAKVEIEIGEIFAKEFGQATDYYNGVTLAEGESFEKKIWEAALNNPKNTATFGMDAKAWKTRGFHKPCDDLSTLDNYIAYEAFLAKPGADLKPSGTFANNKDRNRRKTCFNTLSGRVEAYCMPLMENYEMRMGNNIDEGIDLKNSGKLYTKIAEARTKEGKGRFAYPIPMYIPLIEGRHHIDSGDTAHPDPLGLKNEYKFNLLTWHTIYRSHSTFNSSPLVNEVMFYKRNAKGEQTHIKRKLTNDGAGLDNNNLLDTEKAAPRVWTEDVYETVWINPQTATEAGVAEGDIAILESLRGKVAVSIHISNRVRHGTVSMTQGSWYEPIENWVSPTGQTHNKVDVGGNANTLFGLRPCRIAHGMSLASECRLKIYKA